MTTRSGFFSLSHRRREAGRRHAERETQRRTPSAAGSSANHIESISHTGINDQTRASIPTAIPSHRSFDSIILSADALGSSDAWTLCQVEGQHQAKDLTDASQEALTILTRIADAKSYLDSAESVWDELCTARGILQTSLDCATSPDEQLRFKAVNTLGCIYRRLGDNDKAQSTFLSLCPPLPITRAALSGLHAWHRIDALLDYIRFLVTTARDLDQAENIAKVLPWVSPEVLRSQDRKSHALLSLIGALNYKGRHVEAFQISVTFELTSMTKSLVDPKYILQKAIAAAGKDSRKEAEHLFIDAFTLSSLTAGAWHIQTLHILYQFGRALRVWSDHDSAIKLLMLCCQGYYYVLGVSHPCSIQAYTELKTCKGAGAAITKLRQFGHAQYSPKRKRSMAYERGHLTTPIELLKPEIEIDFNHLADTLRRFLFLSSQDLSKCVKFDVLRCLAWCDLEQNNLDLASTSLYKLHCSIDKLNSNIVGIESYRATLASDEAICSAKSAELGQDFMHQRCKMVYLGLKDFHKERSHQVKAIIRRLTTYKLTHFTRDVVLNDPPLITETNLENLGSGSSAIVDTVKIGGVFYARKSVDLPRQNQRQLRLREELRKEIAIIHALDHPHIIRVLLTYEGTKHFSIIMHPLADCDLETYLMNKICDTIRERQLIWKWMACLINTLAFIHSKDIRHKDIKPRNILIKGGRIYFTDFGSGHIFDDSGDSTTDGPSYGHTKAYCAPEVIKNTNRNRSSDIFSLGCVLIEMASWSSDISMADYFNGVRAESNRTENVLYHESIGRIRLWFEGEQRLNQPSKEIYTEVLRHMIRKNPDLRWTAVKVSHAIGKLLPHTECAKCGVDLWVPDSIAD